MNQLIKDVAFTSAMMAEGAYHLISGMTEVVTHWGWLDAVEFISKHAEICEARYRELLEAGTEVPGVWMYEVCEPFGAELALAVINLKREPTDEEAQAILNGIVDSFMAKDEGSDEEVDGDSGQGN